MSDFLKNRVVLFFTLFFYTLGLTAALLYYRFPAEKLSLYFQFNLEQLLPGTQCSINQLAYRFPFSLAAKEIRCSSREDTKELFTIDQATLTPLLTPLGSHFKVALNAWNGNHTFTLLLDRARREFSLQDIDISGLNLAEVPFLGQAFAREITGSLTGKGNYHAVWKNGKYEADGQGNMTLSNGSFSLLSPILSLQKINLQHVETDFSLQEKKIHVNKGTFSGEELKGTFAGNLGLQSSMKTSILSFQGKLEPMPPLLKKSKHAQNMVILLKKRLNRSDLPFRLEGAVQKPNFRFAP